MYHKHEPCSPVREHDLKFKIECVIVCDSYSDFLRCTLPHNKTIFDRCVVVTSPEDTETRKLCEFYHVHCVASKRLKPAPGKFCKGAAINDGLAVLDGDGWVLHMDADIWLPPQTRQLLQRANLDKRCVYGVDRFNVVGYERWEKFLKKPKLQHEADAYIHANAFPVATRIMSNSMGGWVPIGFFQLWNPPGSLISKYPEGHTDAGREDMLFANYWPRSQRHPIPEVIAYHLESEGATMGANWSGRTTPAFEHVCWHRRLGRKIRSLLSR